MSAPLIYNLFPTLAGDLWTWLAHAKRAQAMGFDWLYLNPIAQPGFSGSLYAVKDHYALNPQLVPPAVEKPLAELSRVIGQIKEETGLRVMIDLVINHASKDAPLAKAHPNWFRHDEKGHLVSPSAIDPSDARKVVVWGDLAEIDNANSADRTGLWAYWTALVQHYVDLGFDGFRCDAAYKVPAQLWTQLIAAARARRSDALFVAETLGCRAAEVRALKAANFDYLCNSSKWWQFDQPWCLDQHAEFGKISPSVAFPESHDTARLAQETDGAVRVQKQRYAFAAAFSAGLLMPIGYEFCFRQRLDVVNTRPADWEQGTTDISGFITAINQLKRNTPVLALEGSWRALSSLDQPTLVLVKTGADVQPVVLAINKDWHASQRINLPSFTEFFADPPAIVRYNGSLSRQPLKRNSLALNPAEIAFIVAD
ncbi:MAG: alpha-amylase [Deltaproteobacteria bacterium]|nr:alpha-amylase [Deltaproteobacteria bacterium]